MASLVWTLPVVALVAAVAGLALAFRRWRGGGARATDADRALVEAARTASDGGPTELARDATDADARPSDAGARRSPR